MGKGTGNAVRNRSMMLIVRALLILVVGLSTILPASAGSGDAWQAMRQKVRAGCLAKANSKRLGKVDVTVDPFGTQSYGTAILIKRGAPRQASMGYVCVMDKNTGEFEVGGELTLR
jgi:hypothetical protein